MTHCYRDDIPLMRSVHPATNRTTDRIRRELRKLAFYETVDSGALTSVNEVSMHMIYNSWLGFTSDPDINAMIAEVFGCNETIRAVSQHYQHGFFMLRVPLSELRSNFYYRITMATLNHCGPSGNVVANLVKALLVQFRICRIKPWSPLYDVEALEEGVLDSLDRGRDEGLVTRVSRCHADLTGTRTVSRVYVHSNFQRVDLVQGKLKRRKLNKEAPAAVLSSSATSPKSQVDQCSSV